MIPGSISLRRLLGENALERGRSRRKEMQGGKIQYFFKQVKEKREQIAKNRA